MTIPLVKNYRKKKLKLRRLLKNSILFRNKGRGCYIKKKEIYLIQEEGYKI